MRWCWEIRLIRPGRLVFPRCALVRWFEVLFTRQLWQRAVLEYGLDHQYSMWRKIYRLLVNCCANWPNVFWLQEVENESAIDFTFIGDWPELDVSPELSRRWIRQQILQIWVFLSDVAFVQPGRAVILLHMKFDDASLSCRAFVAAWALTTFEDVRRETIDPEIALMQWW